MRAVLLMCVLVLAGCSSIYTQQHTGAELFEQIPNWDGEALSVCAGHLPPEQRLPHQSGRC